jgi:uncharacterized protein YndB with AHSA1/START domain
MAQNEIVREVVLDASIAEVWELLTVEGELAAWLGDSVSLEPRPGATGVIAEGDETWRVRVDEVDAHRHVRMSWWPEDGGAASEVSFTIATVEHGTRVVVRERIAGGAGPKGRRLAGSVWDDRMLGLELRCLARASLAHC